MTCDFCDCGTNEVVTIGEDSHACTNCFAEKILPLMTPRGQESYSKPIVDVAVLYDGGESCKKRIDDFVTISPDCRIRTDRTNQRLTVGDVVFLHNDTVMVLPKIDFLKEFKCLDRL